jgi:DNA-binding IclR family transcriptional regulator
MPAGSVRSIGSIRVGCKLLRVLEGENGPLSLKELSRRAGMSPSKAHAYIASFVAEGILRQDPSTGSYGLGSFTMQLGAAAIRQLNVVQMAQDAAEQLYATTHYSTFVSVWGNRGPTIVHKIDGTSALAIRVGHVVSLLGHVSGHLFLAYLSEGETQPVLERELRALRSKDRPDVVAIRRRTRLNQYAMRTHGKLFYAAAPILQHDGQIVASLSIGQPLELSDQKTPRTYVNALRAAATSVSEKLGFAALRRTSARVS